MTGWFGGTGFSAYRAYLIPTRGVAPVFSFLAIIAEFFGGICWSGS